MKRLLTAAVLALVSIASIAAPSAVGMNVSPLSYYSPAPPMIDVMKQAGPWITASATAWDTGEEATLKTDADDNLLALPAATDTTVKWRWATTALSSLGALPLGTYVMTYDGVGTLVYGGSMVRDAKLSTLGRDVIAINGTNNVWLTIKATDPTNPVRNLHFWRPGGACSSDLSVFAADATACPGTFVPYEKFPATASIWYQPWLADMKGFKAIRFMDWNRTNATTINTWAERTTMTARRWTGASGVPIEAELDLANRLQADAWLNVPPYVVDTDYALQIGKLAARMLTGMSRLDLEYANETWNYAFPATGWILNQSNAHWAKQVALPASNQWYFARAWYGERLVQMCSAAKAANPSTRCVANVQAAANGTDIQRVLGCDAAVAYDQDQPCTKGVDIIAIAPYFGGYIGTATYRPTVNAWIAQADGGLGSLFNEINGGGIVAGGSLAQINGWTKANVATAKLYGVPVWAYEGGQGLVMPDHDAKVQALFTAANRDPRMGAAYDRMLADWTAAGGQVFSFYSSSGIASGYGFWGMKLDQADNAAPKWQSAVRAKAVPCTWAACVTKPLTVPPIQ